MGNIPTIHINLNYFVELGNMPFPVMLWRIFLDGGWVVLVFMAVRVFWVLWIDSRQAKFAAKQSYVVLAIDIPRENLQTPKAVEHIFAQLSGAHSNPDRYERWWEGKFPQSMSFEIVSVGGYVQFVARCNKMHRDLVEAAFYAQYPGAEIIEIVDYVDKVPSKYPDPEWDAFGTEFQLKKPDWMPIRTYPEFEDSNSEENIFKDPMSAVLEVMSSLKHGEHLWLQFIVTPTGDDWIKKGEAEINKMLGKETKKGSNTDWLFDIPKGLTDEFVDQVAGASIFGTAGEPAPEKKPEAPNLSPGERDVLSAAQKKLTKIAFKTKIRMVYIGKRDVFSRGKVMGPIKGAFGQFAALHMNGLKVYGKVTPRGDYFYQRWSMHDKESALVRNYKSRSGNGGDAFHLNTEELATLYHFPMSGVMAPAVKKADAKRSEPPASLPTEDMSDERPFDQMKPEDDTPPPEEKKEDDTLDGMPGNLPFV